MLEKNPSAESSVISPAEPTVIISLAGVKPKIICWLSEPTPNASNASKRWRSRSMAAMPCSIFITPTPIAVTYRVKPPSYRCRA
jgi:hypothetical protein